MSTAGYLQLEHFQSASMPYPSGDIAVVNARMQDISGGMRWHTHDAYDIRFLAVNGTVTVGSCQAKYDFTLVEYHLYIDEVSWILFSTLNNALELEFAPEFWDTVNRNRKERWVSASAMARRPTGLRCCWTLPGHPHVSF